MLELKNIRKIYGGKGDSAVTALRGVTLSFRESEFVSILGQSGCGKTTLLNIIGGLDRYTDGDLIINGVSTRDYNDKQWDTYRNHTVGFVFQSYNLIPHQTILENVELSMTLGGLPKSERRQRAKNALTEVGLADKMHKKPNELSGGQMQRASIARAIVGDPDIILADEPTGALDSETSKTVMKLLKDISKTRLVIMVTHNPLLAEEFSDRIICMLDGEITSDSSPFEPTKACESSYPENADISSSVLNENMSSTVASEDALTDSEGKNVSVRLDSESASDTSEDTQTSTVTGGDTDEGTEGDKCEKPQEGAAASHGKLQYKKKNSSMSFFTALRLSAKNLLSKKSRTAIMSFAASIGIIGIAIILSLSSGMSDYIEKTMRDTASFNYLSMTTTYVDIDATVDQVVDDMVGKNKPTPYPEGTTGIYPYKPESTTVRKQQKFSDEFIQYLENESKGLVVDILYSYKVALHVITQKNDKLTSISTSNWKEGFNNFNYLKDKYTVLSMAEGIESGIPSEANEVALVVDKYNRLSTSVLDSIGIPYPEDLSEIKYEDIIGKEYRVVFNDGWYSERSNGTYQTVSLDKAYANENGITVKIVSVLREDKDSAGSNFLANGIAYSPKLTQLVLEKNKNSAIALAQAENEEKNVISGAKFKSSVDYENALDNLGYTHYPTSIIVYPNDVKAREHIVSAIDAWNASHDKEDNIYCLDISNLVTATLGKIVDVITYILLAFSIISLVISSIMIAIIIYASVIERTKEIGVLRSLGARKKDISRVFIAEAGIIGTLSGVIAIILTLVANAVINALLLKMVGVTGIANLTPLTAFLMILLSIGLLFVASLIPAYIAAKKQPAVALRTE